MMYRFHMRARSKSKDAQPAGDLVRYLQREGEFAPKEVERDVDVEYMARTSPDTAHHADLVGQPLVGNMPAWAHGDAGLFFVTASNEERVNGQYAIALQIALPRELTHEQHLALAQDFVDAVMHDKPYLLVKHEPVHNGQAQPHLHILMSPRRLDGIDRSAVEHFRRYNPAHPEQGGAQKDRFWNQRQAPHRLRQAFSDLANYHLEGAGADARIDPRSLRKQGIERERISWNNPTTIDAATRMKEQAQAAASWERRKAYKGLGDIQAIPREEYVLLVRQWTRTYEPGRAVPPSSAEDVAAHQARERERLAQEAQELQQNIRTLETYIATVQRSRVRPAIGRGYDINLRIEDEYERDPQDRSLSR
jgi:MobA/MobL family